MPMGWRGLMTPPVAGSEKDSAWAVDKGGSAAIKLVRRVCLTDGAADGPETTWAHTLVSAK
jgi:hypothetical protein